MGRCESMRASAARRGEAWAGPSFMPTQPARVVVRAFEASA